MASGLSAALALLAQATGAPDAAAAVYGPPAPEQPQPKAVAEALKAKNSDCAAAQRNPESREIVVCAPRTEGYRISPDLVTARREMRSGGRPRSPHETHQPKDCGSVGPAPCQTAGINLLTAVPTALEMASRIARGEEVGSMFKTTPAATEYQLYLEAKARREAAEAEQAALALAKAKQPQAELPPSPAPTTDAERR
ncbi:MAG TPA: hypothetical protein VM308_08030 [Sphingomicrobium sp.]|nr:hypothetical protein [Sphingomicrobium sp.]